MPLIGWRKGVLLERIYNLRLDRGKTSVDRGIIIEQSPITTRLSGPQEPPSDRNTSRPSPKMDKRKAKMPEYKDLDDNESTHSLDSEFEGLDVPFIRMNGVKKAITATNEKLLLNSTRDKNPVC